MREIEVCLKGSLSVHVRQGTLASWHVPNCLGASNTARCTDLHQPSPGFFRYIEAMVTHVIRHAALGVSLLVVGCPADQDTSSADSSLPTPKAPESSTGGASDEETSASASTSTTADVDGTGIDSAGTTDAEGSESGTGCAAGCTRPPNDCYATPGECVDGECQYAFSDQGTPCDDGDLCSEGDTCDGAGSCNPGEMLECDRPNAENGACVDGECQGWSCVAPYENCDGDWANGCEIPTGVANACNDDGISEEGACGTAYCGTMVGPTVVNFPAGNYRCVMCSNCTEFVEGQTSWCNQNTGHWWPAEPGNCPSSYEHAVCGP